MIYRCDCCDTLEAITGGRKWVVDELTWRDDGVRYATASFEEAMAYTVEMVARYCGMDLRITTGHANIVSQFRRLDGTNGVLARQELPGQQTGQHEVRFGQWDSSERPNQRILNVVTAHEVAGHALGLLHYNSEPSLMNAQLNPRFHDEWDDWTIDELRDRYGSPRTVVPAPDCGTILEQLCAGLWQVPR